MDVQELAGRPAVPVRVPVVHLGVPAERVVVVLQLQDVLAVGSFAVVEAGRVVELRLSATTAAFHLRAHVVRIAESERVVSSLRFRPGLLVIAAGGTHAVAARGRQPVHRLLAVVVGGGRDVLVVAVLRGLLLQL